jgi:hypothetical protein
MFEIKYLEDKKKFVVLHNGTEIFGSEDPGEITRFCIGFSLNVPGIEFIFRSSCPPSYGYDVGMEISRKFTKS